MAKYDLNHISSLDYSAYGYVGATIERLNVAEVKRLLEAYDSDEDIDSLNSFVAERSLLSLAFDNLERVDNDDDLGKAFAIIDALMKDSIINKREVSEEGSSFFTSAIGALQKHEANPKIKAFILDKINALSVEAKDGKAFIAPLLKSKNAVKEIEVLKRELSDSFLKGISKENMDEWLVEDALYNLDRTYELGYGKGGDDGYRKLLIKMIDDEMLNDKLDVQLAHNITVRDYIINNLDQVQDPIAILYGMANAAYAPRARAEMPEVVSAKVVSSVDKAPTEAIAEEVALSKASVLRDSVKLREKDVQAIYKIVTTKSEKGKKYKDDIFPDIYNAGLIPEEAKLELGYMWNTTATDFGKKNRDSLGNRKSMRAINILSSSGKEEDKRKAAKEVALFELYEAGEAEALASKLEYMENGSPELNELKDGYSLFHKACFNGNTELAKLLFAKGVDPFLVGDKGLDAIHILSLNNNPEASLSIFQEMKKDEGFSEKIAVAQANPENGFMYSMLALKSGNVKLADELLSLSTQNVKKLQSEIFIRAAKSDDAELVRNFLKLESSKDFNPHVLRDGADDFDGVRRALMGSGEVFKAILGVESDSSQNLTNKPRINPNVKLSYHTLEESVTIGNVQAVEAILSCIDDFKNIDINLINKEGNQDKNILNIAYSKKAELEYEVLFLEQQRSETPDNAEKARYQVAINQRKKQVEGVYGAINKLLEHGVAQFHEPANAEMKKNVSMLNVNAALSINPKDYKGEKQNVLTCAYSELAQARQALKERSSYAKDSQNGREVIRVFGEKWREDLEKDIQLKERMVNSILDHPNADITIADEFGTSLMMLAAKYGDKHCLGVSVLRGSNAEKGSGEWIKTVNARDARGNTALFYAAEFGEVDAFELLVSEGAKLRSDGKLIKNNDGISPLMAACGGGHLKVVKAINPNASDVKERDKNGNTALHYLAMGLANEENSRRLSNELIEIADIEVKNNDGCTPLILAAISGNYTLFTDLLSKGADVNAVDGQGNTPLIYACLLNDKAMIETILAESNLDINHRNKAGISAFLIASQRDGLESLSNDAKEQMIKKLDSLHPKIKEMPGLYDGNSYTDLPKTLIKRGAEPYVSGPVNIMDSTAAVSAAIAAAETARMGSQVVAKSLPIYGGIASEFLKLGSAFIAAATVRTTTKKAVKAGVVSYLTDNTEFDKRIDLGDAVMIGSFHDKGISFIRSGKGLERDIASHNNFKKSDKRPIYTIKDLKDVINKDLPVSGDAKGVKDMKPLSWYMRAHEDLTSHYVAVQKSIENQPWYYTIPLFWKGMGLKQVAKDILEADKVLADSNQGREFLKASHQEPSKSDSVTKTFEEVFGVGKDNLVEIIKSAKASKSLLSAIIENEGKGGDRDPKIDEVAELVNKVIRREISVAPDTFYAFVKFDDENRKLNAKKSREEFVKTNKPLIAIHGINKGAVASFAARRGDCVKRSQGIGRQQSNEVEVKPPATVIRGLQWLMGAKDPYKARNDVAGAVGEVTGSVAGAYAAAQLNPEVKSAMIQLRESTSVGAVQGAKIAATVLGTAAANPMATTTVAVGVGIAYYWAPITKALSSTFSPLFSSAEVRKAPAEAKDIKSACAKDIDTKTFNKLTPDIKERGCDIAGERRGGEMGVRIEGKSEVNHVQASANSMERKFDELLTGYDDKDKRDFKSIIKEVEEALIKSGVSREVADNIIVKELDRDMKAYDKSKSSPAATHAHAIEEERKLLDLVKSGMSKGG